MQVVRAEAGKKVDAYDEELWDRATFNIYMGQLTGSWELQSDAAVSAPLFGAAVIRIECISAILLVGGSA